jgi:hypothetical protein
MVSNRTVGLVVQYLAAEAKESLNLVVMAKDVLKLVHILLTDCYLL